MRFRGQLLFLAIVVPTSSLPAIPAGAQWRIDGVPLCTAASNQFTPVAIPDGAGGAIITWFDYRGGSADIYAQHVLTSGMLDPTWPANGLAVCAAAGGQYAPAIVGVQVLDAADIQFGRLNDASGRGHGVRWHVRKRTKFDGCRRRRWRNFAGAGAIVRIADW